MAALTVVSTAAAVVSATQSAFELTAKATPLFARCDARDYLNQALTFREESLKLMERYQAVLPHKMVHEWRAKHTIQVTAWENIQKDLDAFDSLGIIRKTFSLRLRKNITSTASMHAKDCMKSWTKTKSLTDHLRSYIVSRTARENGVLSIDLFFSSEEPNASNSNPTTLVQIPAGSPQHEYASPPKCQDGSNPFISSEDGQEYAMNDLQPASGAQDGTSKDDSQLAHLRQEVQTIETSVPLNPSPDMRIK